MSPGRRGQPLVAFASKTLWATLFLLSVGCMHHEDRSLLARTASTEPGDCAAAGDLCW